MALANQISYTDFTGILNIDFRESEKQTHMTNLITHYQQKILRDLLGESLYQDLYENNTASKWLSFLNGETVTIDGYKYEWVGAKEMLKYFLYYYFKRETESFDSSFGEQSSNSQNSTSNVQQANKKLAERFNQAIDYYKDAYDYLLYKNELVTDTFENIESETKFNINHLGI